MLVFVWLALLAASTASSPGLPASPCPHVFRYEAREVDGWFGHLVAPAPKPQSQLHVTVRLFVRAALTSANAREYGRLRLKGDRDEVASQIFHQTIRRVDYEVYFPIQSPLPEVEQITANNVVICRGPPGRSRAGALTKILLEHTLTPRVTQVGSPHDHEAALPDIGPRTGGEPAPCGVAASGARPLVYRGTPTDRGEWPWLAAVYLAREMKFVCGGSLVSMRHVVTAGHCLRGRDGLTREASDVVTVLGKYNLNKWVEPRNQNRVITEVRLHPDFDYLTLAHDIAVLTLESKVEYTSVVRPVCLWDSATDVNLIVGRVGTVVGWGHDVNRAEMSDRPRQVAVTVVSQEECLRSHPDFRDVTGWETLCAGDKDGSGPCSGDSGGPLLLHKDLANKRRWHLRGVISRSLTDRVNMTCDLSQYVVYTDVAKYLDWLRQFILDN